MADNQITNSSDKIEINTTNSWEITEEDIRSILGQGEAKSIGKRELKKIKNTIEKLIEWKKGINDKASTSEELLELVKKEGANSSFNEEIAFLDVLLSHGEELAKFMSVVSKKTIRQSSDLIDNKLRSQVQTKKELTLFDLLESKTIVDAHEKQSAISAPSLNLDAGEERLVHTLNVLLCKKSEQWNQDSPDYYMGNFEKGHAQLSGISLDNDSGQQQHTEVSLATARMIITPHELYTTYMGKESYGGDQTKHILKTLDSLSKKNFLISLTVPTKGGKFQKLRTYLSLFQLVVLNKDLSLNESQEIDENSNLIEGKQCVLLFKFSPLFTNNIREKYIEIPEDIHLRIAHAAGGRRIPQCAFLLKDLLLREKQLKRYSLLRDEDTLIDILQLRKLRDEGRKKKVTDHLNKAFDICSKIGLLKTVTLTSGKQCQPQYALEINPNFR